MSSVKDLIRRITQGKITPSQRITRLKIRSNKLRQREDEFRSRADKARVDAKDALRSGDERAYLRLSAKYTSNRKGLETTENIHDVCYRLLDLMELAKGLVDIVNIGVDIGEMQNELGVDSLKLEKALTNITESIVNVEAAADSIGIAVNSVLTSGDDIKLDQEILRKELLVELELEKTEEEELMEEIERERDKEE